MNQLGGEMSMHLQSCEIGVKRLVHLGSGPGSIDLHSACHPTNLFGP